MNYLWCPICQREHEEPACAPPALSASGMTLRDWFAGQALNALPNLTYGAATIPEMAKAAYEIADAMIAQRSKH